MGELSMDNILTEDEAANLFLDMDVPEDEDKETTPDEGEQETTEVEPDELFDEIPESVGSEEKTGKKEDTTSSDEDGSSPSNIYSSFASALKEEGIFPDLDDESLSKIVGAEEFRDAVQAQMEAGLDAIQKRIYNALNDGVQPDEIKQFEQTLSILSSISDEQIEAETPQGEDLRRRLIQQDLLNRGYSNERAAKMTEKLFASGEDIDEAKQALLGNREFFTGEYNKVLNTAKQKAEQERREQQQRAEQLKNDILKGEKIFGEIPVDKNTRQKVYDNITKAAYRDPETGEYYTALQKYRMENESEYIKNVGLLFTLTDGFTNMDKLVKPSAKKEVKKKLKELEHTLSNTAKGGGNLKLVGSGSSNAGSLFDRGFSIDIN